MWCAIALILSLLLASDRSHAAVQQPAQSTAAARPRVPTVVRKVDVIYGRVQGSALLADLAYTETEALKPAVLYVFGGRWRAGSRLENQGNWERLARWAEAGFFTMTIDHRLVGGSPAPAPYQDALCAVRWLHSHAAEFGVDENQIYVIGNSSGGHIAALIAMLGDGSYPRTGGWENARSDIRGAISVAAPYDLNTLSWGNLWTPVEGEAQVARRLASPIAHVSVNSRPLLVVHSDDDQSVPIQQALDMVKALEASNVHHKLVRYKDRGHMGLTDEVLEEARAFIKAGQGESNADPYSGTWVLNLAKTGGSQRTQVLTIRVSNDEEVYESDMRAVSGRRQLTRYTARYDNNEYPSVTVVTESNGTVTREENKVRLEKLDEKTRTRTWTQNGQVTVLRRKVSPDGRTMTSESVVLDATGRQKQPSTVLVFDKQ
jgi:acetyl esterase/lipase